MCIIGLTHARWQTSSRASSVLAFYNALREPEHINRRDIHVRVVRLVGWKVLPKVGHVQANLLPTRALYHGRDPL